MKCCLLVRPPRAFVFFSFLTSCFLSLFSVFQNLHVGHFSHHNCPSGFPGIPFSQLSPLVWWWAVWYSVFCRVSQLRGCHMYRTGECEQAWVKEQVEAPTAIIHWPPSWGLTLLMPICPCRKYMVSVKVGACCAAMWMGVNSPLSTAHPSVGH